MKLARVSLAVTCAIGAVSCSLFVSTSDLSNGASPTDASDMDDVVIASDAAPPTDAGDAGHDATTADAYRAVVLTDSPSGYWRLDDTSAGTVADTMGKYPGTIVGGVVTGVAGALSDDSAMHFDGTSAVIDLGDVLDFPARAPFSFELWISPEAVDSVGRTALGKIVGTTLSDGGAIYDGYSFYFMSTHGVFFMCASEAPACATPNSPAPVAGTFQHVVATYDGSVASTYYNGALVASGSYTKSLIDNTTHLRIGSENGSGFFQGTIDEVAIYDHALTAARVSAHYAARH